MICTPCLLGMLLTQLLRAYSSALMGGGAQPTQQYRLRGLKSLVIPNEQPVPKHLLMLPLLACWQAFW